MVHSEMNRLFLRLFFLSVDHSVIYVTTLHTFFQVERIVDKRKNKKGKWEYLIRWKGYGSKEDTWEPEHHLLHCEEFIDQFNSLRLQERRSKPAKPSGATARNLSQSGILDSSKSRGETRKKKRTSGMGAGGGGGPGLVAPQKPRKVTGGKPTADRTTKPMTYKSMSSGLQFVPPIRGPTNGLQNGEIDPLHYRTTARTQVVPSSRVERMIGSMDHSGAAPPPMNELGKAVFLYSICAIIDTEQCVFVHDFGCNIV